MLRLRHLRLRATTHTTIYGCDIPFAAGLNVLHAGNTSGKSTCLQSIIYALGLERSLGPQLEVPLPYAMRERIHKHPDEPYEPVLESYVELEIENSRNEKLVVRRDVIGDRDRRLIQSWNVPRLTEPNAAGARRDFFVRDPGAAQRDDGFHSYFAHFLDWELPQVPRFDGSESPLYLEAIFPMLFVEQKRGWSTIQGPFPTFLRIQDVARRVMEFLLDLQAGNIRRERAELRRMLTTLQQRWTDKLSFLEELGGRVVRSRGIPTSPTAEFSHRPEVTIEVLQDDDWQPISVVIERSMVRMGELDSIDIPTADSAAPAIQEQLIQARARADELMATVETVRGDYSTQLEEHRAIERRVEALEADLKRNQDALRLKRFGSELGKAAGEQICPTCHQSVSSELLPTVASAGMGIEENIAFVRSQLELYKATLAGSTERLNDYRARYYSDEQEMKERQQEIRGLRQSLVQPGSSPARSVIEEIVRRQAFIDRLASIQQGADSLMDELKSIATEWAILQDRLQRLSADDLTAADKEKINDLQSAIQRHLVRYGFRSFQPNEIHLSSDNFRPLVYTREKGEIIEKEINFEVSASDAIRLKWAYYLSMLSTSQRQMTKHCGLVIFDEPGQQEMEKPSLAAFLDWASKRLRENQQVIVATSEQRERLANVLDGTAARLISFEGFILQPTTN
jgi:hypothetical protein